MQFKYLFLFLFLICNSFSLLASDVSGVVTLENEQAHNDVSVRFVAISNSARTNQTLTNTDGIYNLQLENGIYKLIISKDGFTDLVLDEISIENDSVLNDFELLARGQKEIAGIVSGTFYRDTTYFVNADLIVEDGQQLLIQPGTHIKFNGNYEIRVYGQLLAEGAENDSILFTPNKTTKNIGDWESIVLFGNDTSKISYAILEYGGSEINRYGLITAKDSAKVLINHCKIEYSERGGVYCLGAGYAELENSKIGYAENTNVYFSTGTSGFIKNNFIYNGAVRGLYHEFREVEVSGNVISDCYAGIWTLTPGKINNNVVSNCSRGIYFFDGTGNLLVTNNTLINNEYGVAFNDDPNINARISNNIFYNNDNGIGYPWDVESTPSTVSYNLFYENQIDYESSLSGFGNIITENANNTPADTYFNIFVDPLLYLPELTEPYYGAIKDNSPAIGAASQTGDMGAYSFNNNAPAAFSILSNEIVYYDYDSVTIDFVWEESIDSDQKAEFPYYNLYLTQEDTLFQSEKIESTSFQFVNTGVLEQNSEYQVSVISSDGLSKTEANNTITLNTPNLAPSVFQILDLNVVNTDSFDSEIALSWSPNLDTDALTYAVMIGRNGEYENTGETSQDSTSVIAALIENTTYQCFVMADDGQLTTSSDTISFLTPNSPPTAFELLLPKNDSALYDREILFSWEEANDQSEVSYQLTIFNNQENIKINDIETNQYRLNTVENLNPSSEYLWLVSASDGVDITYSLTRRFSTQEVLSVDDSEILDINPYPNPARDEILVDLPYTDTFYYQIFDLNGSLLDRSKLDGDKTIDVSNLNEGIYQLIIISEKDDKIGVVRFVKE